MKQMRGWLLRWLIVLLLLAPITGCFAEPTPIDPTKQLTEFTKPAVVRIVSYNSITYHMDVRLAELLGIEQDVTGYDGGTGSGAILTSDGYIVTNAHVIESAEWDSGKAEDRIHQQFIDQLQALIKEKAPDYQRELLAYALNTTHYDNLERVQKVVLPGGDEYPFELTTYGKPMGEGEDVAILKIRASHLPIIEVDVTDHVQTGDKVVIAGYPGKADLQGYLDEESALVSTYTNGAIAARKKSANGPLLQLDANVNPGNSGGPVFTLDGKMVGIATATSQDGIGWAIPASTILEYTQRANITVNQPDLVTEKWREGLTLYWQGYYVKALPLFGDVQRLYGKHYEINNYISHTQSYIDEGQSRTDWSDYTLYLILAGVVVIFIGGTFLKRRN